MGLDDMLGNSEVQTLDLTKRDRRYSSKLSLKDNRRNDFQWFHDVQKGLNQHLVDGGSVRATFMLVAHDHAYTVGAASINKDGSIMEGLLRENHPPDVPIIPVNRGGTITYHGPGQLVIYHINRIHKDQELVHKSEMEKFYMEILGHPDFGINAHSRKKEDASLGRGAWLVHEGAYRKLVSQGTQYVNAGRDKRTGKLCVATMHGFAMNINTDMSYFRGINPCGFDSGVMISMSDILGREIKIDEVREHVIQKIDDLR